MSDTQWEHFYRKELECRCGCGQMPMNEEFMDVMVVIRKELNFPLTVTSAYRCPTHNNNESSTGFNGPHTTGQSIDILISRKRAFLLIECALKYGMTGIGVKQKGEDRFIHLDNLTGPNRPTVWSY